MREKCGKFADISPRDWNSEPLGLHASKMAWIKLRFTERLSDPGNGSFSSGARGNSSPSGAGDPGKFVAHQELRRGSLGRHSRRAVDHFFPDLLGISDSEHAVNQL